MKRAKDISIRKKLFISILAFSVSLVVIVTIIVGFITYQTMREQLIYNRRMSIRWLQDRLNSEVDSYSDRFYEFEVNKKIKKDITSWCNDDQEIDYTVKLNLITMMNETISMDKNLNSIEIYNFAKNQVLVAKRSGADIEEIGDGLDRWNLRNQELQTNIVFFRNEKNIEVSHEIYSFHDKTPMVLITMKLRPYDMEEILEDIKTTKDESILIFNDQNELIEDEYGTGVQFDQRNLDDIINELSNRKVQELYQDGNFWFFREVSGGKLKILMTVPIRSILEALNSTLAAGITIGMIAVIISTIGSILFSRAFSKPIIELSAMMRTITIDDFSDVILNEREDEIGILHDSFGVMIDRNKRLIAQEYQSKIEKREAQIRALQAQINPHFMYNTLQVIGGMALKKDVPQVYKITTALGDIMRYSLNFSNEMVCLREEIEYFKAYLMIQDERFGNRINLEINMEETVLDYLIPKLILQPLIENSLEHGLSGKSGEWRIILAGRLTDEGDLLLTLGDNGVGIEPERLLQIQDNLRYEAEKSLKSSSHIGLCNVNSRIKLKFSEDKYGISITSTYGEGTTVQVLTKTLKREM
ncbi:MAG: sensor histidine kinase [Herbinix sp.]|nr:sensor histidine kinase [Herbinix sp.]